MTRSRATAGTSAKLGSPASSGSRATAVSCDKLRDTFAAYRAADSRLLLRLCLASAYFIALRGPRWMAHSQRDYANALLGVSPSTLLEWVRVGRLLCQQPHLRAEFREGHTSLRALDALARHGFKEQDAKGSGEDHAPGASAHRADKQERKGTNSEPATTGSAGGDESGEFTNISFSAPAPAVLYLEDSLELARAIVGRCQGDEEAISALLAEAGGEGESTVDAARARRRFGVRDGRTHTPRSREQSARLERTARTLPHPRLPVLGEIAQRRYAFRLHALLQRLLARRNRLRLRQEDQLYEWMLDGLHERYGYSNFERFARALLDLPQSTCTDRLRRARERRRKHPIALARARGKLSTVQADLLALLHRRCHVPVSDLWKWIRYALRHTVRGLRAAMAWARRQLLTDYRAWSLAGCAPPDEDQLRTGNHSLEVLVRNPEHAQGATLHEALLAWNDAPRGTARFRLSLQTRDELLMQLASEQDRVRAQAEVPAPRRIPAWLALCRLFYRARKVWADHHQSIPASQRRILDRDGWRCATPECTQRRNLQVHHLQYRARGGDDRDSNRITLCAFHHQIGEHQGLLRVRGEVGTDGKGLTWEMGLDEHGRPFRVYRDERLMAST